MLLGPKVQIYTTTHPLNPAERKDGWELALPVEIGNNVWISGSAIICPGITIENASTTGAGSVVTRDVPPKVVVGGNPCRVIQDLVG